MGNRLTKIYTKTGDDGTTGLGVKERIEKDSLRIHAIGDIDELNSTIGLLIESVPADSAHRAHLRQIQHDLFDLGGELAMPGYALLDEQIISELEALIDDYNATLAPLANFILPGGSEPSARAHLARSICRRAERSCVTFNRNQAQPHMLVQKYLNRLSDYLFVLARKLTDQSRENEILWQSRHKKAK